MVLNREKQLNICFALANFQGKVALMKMLSRYLAASSSPATESRPTGNGTESNVISKRERENLPGGGRIFSSEDQFLEERKR